jgi:cell division protease FtsH
VGGLDENNQSKSEVSVNVSSSRMTYGRFLEYLEMGWVKQVDLYDNSRNAVQASSPDLEIDLSQSVEIPMGASQLIH